MSGDLISRDKLLEDFRNTITEKSDTLDWSNMISRQPVAYDVDKVLEELESDREYFQKESAKSVIIRDFDYERICREKAAALGTALKVVKGGGLNG